MRDKKPNMTRQVTFYTTQAQYDYLGTLPNASAAIRDAIATTMHIASEKRPTNRYNITYRSFFGDLNTAIITACDEADVQNVFDGSEIISIEKVQP